MGKFLVIAGMWCITESWDVWGNEVESDINFLGL